jgi:hypothetical protein
MIEPLLLAGVQDYSGPIVPPDKGTKPAKLNAESEVAALL